MEENNGNKKRELIRLRNLKNRGSGYTLLGFNIKPLTRYPFKKLIWLSFFLISLGLFIYSTIANINNYLEYNVVTSSKIVHQSSIEFPIVSFCNLNMFAKNSSILDEIVLVLNQNEEKSIMSTKSNFESLKKLQHLIKSYTSGSTMNDDQRKSFGLSIEEMLLSCYFNGEPCSAEDFEWFYTFDYGNCFAFNSGFNSELKKKSVFKKCRNFWTR